ncbi:MAG: tyrosine-type recombinase/integrase [Bacteroidales bacterium]|nr:tyrosine-type recombinase/integrase [Candidatus Latescibacterota bacterium]
MPKLTKRLVEELKPKTHDYRVWDDKTSGFGVRVKPSGALAYFVSYRNKGKKVRRFTIGRSEEITPMEARKKAIQFLAQVSLGHDPMAIALETAEVTTFGDLASEYLQRKGSEKVIKEDARILEKDVLPTLGDIPVEKVQRRTVVILIDKIRDRGSPVMANRCGGLVKRIYSFGISRGVIEENPARDIKSTRERSRDRVLTDKEIAVFWDRVDDLPYSTHLKSALKLILVTGQRPGEVIGAEWDDFDFENGVWNIPGEKTKNRLSHSVPLSSLAEEIIRDIPRHDGSRFLFPAKRGKSINDSKHMHVSAMAHAIGLHREIFGKKSWSPHDLRRTAATGLASLGISRLVVSKILNHKDRAVTGIYDRFAYETEKRQALEAWAQKIVEITEGRKGIVIPLMK